MKTVILQSHKDEGLPDWLEACMASVRAWAAMHGYAYHREGDALFDRLPADLRARTADCKPAAADLGRLFLARETLAGGAERVVWLDADVFVFDPDGFTLDITTEYAFGREVWIQPDAKGHPVARRHVHNAVCVFCAGNSFLDFYLHAAQAIARRAARIAPAQMLGPKFLTHQHNLIGFPLIDAVAMASPLVLRDLAAGGGPALDLWRTESPGPVRAVNLCSSLVGTSVDGVAVTEGLLARAMAALLRPGPPSSCPATGPAACPGTGRSPGSGTG